MKKTATEIIKDVNQGYSILLEEIIKYDNIFSIDVSNENLPLIINKAKAESGIVLKTSDGLIPSLHKKVLEIIETLDAFWETNREIYLNALGSLKCYKLNAHSEFDYNNFLYFDIVIIPEYLSDIQMHPHFWKTVLQMVIHINKLKEIMPFLNCKEDDFPLIAIYPQVNNAKDIERFSKQSFTGKYDNDVLNIGEQNTISFLKKILKADIDFDTTYKLRELGDYGDINISKIFDLTKINEVYSDFHNYELPKQSKVGSELISIYKGNAEVVSGEAFQWFLKYLQGEFTSMAAKDYSCLITKSDPLIINQNFFKEKINIENSNMPSYMNLSEEAYAALSIQSMNFSTLSNLDINKILEFRQSKGLLYFREKFRNLRNTIKFASIDDIEKISQEFNLQIKSDVDEFNLTLRQVSEEINKKQKKSKLKVGLSAAIMGINLLTIPVPYLAAITIPGSFLLGGPSILEYIQDKKKVKKLKQELEDIGVRPLAVLSKITAGNNL